VLYYPAGASCWEPWVKGLTLMTNSIYNGWALRGCLARQIMQTGGRSPGTHFDGVRAILRSGCESQPWPKTGVKPCASPGDGRRKNEANTAADHRSKARLLPAFGGAGAPPTPKSMAASLKSYSIDSPASMSIHEEATVFSRRDR